MSKEFLGISDGIYTLRESEKKNQFYFYRNDEEVLSEQDEEEAMRLYGAYITHKMMNGLISGIVANEICSEMSDDRKCIRMTVLDSTIKEKKKPSFWKRLFSKNVTE